MIGIEEVNKGLDNVTQMGYKNILIYPCIQELRFQVKMGNGSNSNHHFNTLTWKYL